MYAKRHNTSGPRYGKKTEHGEKVAKQHRRIAKARATGNVQKFLVATDKKKRLVAKGIRSMVRNAGKPASFVMRFF